MQLFRFEDVLDRKVGTTYKQRLQSPEAAAGVSVVQVFSYPLSRLLVLQVRQEAKVTSQLTCESMSSVRQMNNFNVHERVGERRPHVTF